MLPDVIQIMFEKEWTEPHRYKVVILMTAASCLPLEEKACMRHLHRLFPSRALSKFCFSIKEDDYEFNNLRIVAQVLFSFLFISEPAVCSILNSPLNASESECPPVTSFTMQLGESPHPLWWPVETSHWETGKQWVTTVTLSTNDIVDGSVSGKGHCLCSVTASLLVFAKSFVHFTISLLALF